MKNGCPLAWPRPSAHRRWLAGFEASWLGMGNMVVGAPYLHFTLILRGIEQSDSADGTLVFLGNLLGRLLGLAGRLAASLTSTD